MQVPTTTGELAPVVTRSWPLAGLDTSAQFSQSWGNVQLASFGTGELRFASYYQLYRASPWIYACVQLKAKNLARLPIHVFELDAKGNRSRVRGDLPNQGRPSNLANLDSLLQNPSPGVSRNRQLRQTFTDRHIYGNALWVKERNPYTGAPQRLWRAPWRNVTVHTGENVPVLAYEVKGNLGLEGRYFDPADVVHFAAGDDPDKPIGMSPLEPLRYTMQLLDAMQRHLSAYFANQARLSGHLKVAPNTPRKSLDWIREQVTQLYTSPENAGKVLVTSADFQPMSVALNQSDIVELTRLSREEILAAFSIPPPVAGILDRAIKSNVIELREQFGRDVLGPDAEEFEEELRAQLIEPSPQWNYAFAEFQFAEILRPDPETMARTMRDLEHTLSPDERRRIYNYEPIGTPDAKVPTTPMAERPLGFSVDEYGAPRQPGAAPLPPPEPTPAADDENALEDEDE